MTEREKRESESEKERERKGTERAQQSKRARARAGGTDRGERMKRERQCVRERQGKTKRERRNVSLELRLGRIRQQINSKGLISSTELRARKKKQKRVPAVGRGHRSRLHLEQAIRRGDRSEGLTGTSRYVQKQHSSLSSQEPCGGAGGAGELLDVELEHIKGPLGHCC